MVALFPFIGGAGLAQHAGAHLGQLGSRQRDQPLVRQVALVTHRTLADVLGHELAHAGDHVEVRLLHVDEQRARHRVLARRDVSKVGATPSISEPWMLC